MVDWLSLSESSGSGYQLVSVTALPNYGSARTTTLVVSGHTAFTNVEVEQEAYEIIITPLTYTFDYTGGTQAFSVYSNSNWSVSSYPNWLTLDVLGGGSGTTVINATAGNNYTASGFSSSIVVSNQTSSASTDVYQDYNEANSYLKFTVVSSGTITFVEKPSNYGSTSAREVSYRKNGGEWGTLTYVTGTTGDTFINVLEGDVVEFKADNLYYGSIHTGSEYYKGKSAGFSGTAVYDVSGNIMSLLDSNNFQSMTSFTSNMNAIFGRLFEGSKVRDASRLVLPAVALEKYCYYDMFYGCSLLTATPKLPATTLADYCYFHMFSNCTSLLTVQELPATALTDYCYYYMFSDCTSLSTAPELPATNLANYCYSSMFRNCRGLTAIPELPATTLVYGCYSWMFAGCIFNTRPELPATTLATFCYTGMFADCVLSITPELPATTLADECYSMMFSGCVLNNPPVLSATTLAPGCYDSMFADSSLTTAPELPATTLAHGCYQYMFDGCRSLTTAPELPATTLADNCYWGMFYNCRSLTRAPELSAETLVSGCYQMMFYKCSNLSYIKTLAKGDIITGTGMWVYGVSSTGTFVRTRESNWSLLPEYEGIPNGWTVQYID